MIELLFWFPVALVLYVYFGYPLLMWTLSKLHPAQPVEKADITPTVSLIIPAYNEELVIAQKIENSLALDYPRDKLEIIVASDGSTDATNEIAQGFTDRGVRLVALDQNRGKSVAENQAIARATGEILLFTDANVTLRLNAAREIVSNFGDNFDIIQTHLIKTQFHGVKQSIIDGNIRLFRFVFAGKRKQVAYDFDYAPGFVLDVL